MSEAGSTYKRQPPPLLMRSILGAGLFGIGRPMMRFWEKTGRAERAFQKGTARRYQRLAENNPFQGYTPSAHDVIVATYAKSGTNWMMQMAHQLLFHGGGEFEHIHCVVPWPDTADMGPLRRYAIPLEDDSVWRASPEQKRVIKTHFPWELIPYSKDARYIMVIRDPKDVFVSSYFFFVKDGPLAGPLPTLDTWYKVFLAGNLPVAGSWVKNTAGYWAQRHLPNVLVLSFKSMKRDLRGTVDKLAAFLDVRVSGEILDRVAEKSSFDYMNRIDEKFRMWKMIPWRGENRMLRKGAHGGSSELLSLERQREMDARFMAELKRLGSDFPYGEFCEITPGAERSESAVHA
ncbi:MAG TPA: sulfotransferase domain-containing protein [Bryobacteraceae bacterium]|nr:sulfotransferase domain-containing protein [Bryobacteraceae bacterium]